MGRDDKDTVKGLLNAKADVTRTREGGLAPTFAAIGSGGTDALGFLLESRADVAHVADDGSTPVSHAATTGQAGALCSLIAAGGDPHSAKASQAHKPKV